MAIVLFLCGAAPAKLATKVTAKREPIALSESLTVTLSLEGPAPLRIEPPGSWLSDDSAAIWKIGKLEPAKVVPLPEGRERWSVTFRVDPFVPGDAVPLQFASAMVAAGVESVPRPVNWDGLEVRVVTALKDKSAEPRPITGIEALPAVAPVEIVRRHDRLAAGFAVIAFAGMMLVLARYFRQRTRETPAAWALRELASLERDVDVVSPLQSLNRLSFVARVYLERRTGLPATRLTTAELMLAAGRSGRVFEARQEPVASADGETKTERSRWALLRHAISRRASKTRPDLQEKETDVPAWRAILEACDAAKFARGLPGVADCRARLAEARHLIETAASES